MKLSVIGAGYWGANLIRAFKQLGVLHNICEPSAGRIEEIAALLPDVPIERSHGAVVSDPVIDGMVIALLKECRYFLEPTESPRRPKTDGHRAWRVFRVMETSQRSLSMNGKPASLECAPRFLEVVGA